MRDRSAAALPAVLLVLAIASALTVGAAYVSRSMVAAGIQAKRDLELGFPAEEAMTRVITAWDSLARASQPIGYPIELQGEQPDAEAPTLWITRLSPDSYWVVGTYSVGIKPEVRRRTGLLILTRNGLPTAPSDHLWMPLP